MKKILIVDDEPHVALVIKQFLERTGLTVFTALNGELALALIKQECPDVIITDVQMPKMGGIELCKIIQRDYSDLKCLLILMTSRTDREIRIWIDQQNNIEMIEKPLSLRRLLNRINDYFSSIGS